MQLSFAKIMALIKSILVERNKYEYHINSSFIDIYKPLNILKKKMSYTT